MTEEHAVGGRTFQVQSFRVRVSGEFEEKQSPAWHQCCEWRQEGENEVKEAWGHTMKVSETLERTLHLL